MRIDIREVDAGRIAGAIKRRAADIPHVFAWRFSDEGERARKRLSKYRDIHRGERCFVIANGPSLKATNVRKLAGEFTISMNRAYLMYDEWGFIPTYYACINELVLQQFSEDIDRLPMPKFVSFDSRRLFRSETNYVRLPPRFQESFSADITRPMTSGGTVTYVALQLAFYMGFTKVVIVGMDHRFSDKGTPGKTEVRSSAQDHNHMHPNYFPQGVKWQLPDLARSEHAYALARTAFERSGRSIVDATIGGACPVFEKVALDSLVS